MKKSQATKEALSERIELLSSSSIESLDAKNDDGDEEKTGETGEKPMRFRERLYNLFTNGSRRKKSVECGNDSSHSENSEDVTTNSSTDSNNSSCNSFSLLDTEAEEIRKLKELIKKQEEEEEEHLQKLKSLKKNQKENQDLDESIHSILSNKSSICYDEETYLNTIKNQHIPPLPEEEEDHDYEEQGGEEEEEEEEDLPVTKMFLSYYPEQASLYKLEKNLIELGDYQLLFNWDLWNETRIKDLEGSSANLKIKLKTDYKVKTKLEMTEIMVGYKTKFRSARDFQVHLFRSGYKPKRSSVINGTVLAIKVSHNSSYKLWKNLLRIFLDDKFLQSEDLTVYKLKNSVIGLSFFLKNDDHEIKRKILLVKIWIKNICDPIDLCELLKNSLPYEFSNSIDLARFYDNRDFQVRQVYE